MQKRMKQELSSFMRSRESEKSAVVLGFAASSAVGCQLWQLE